MNAYNIEALSETEIEAVEGGVYLWLAVVGVAAAGAAAANELMDFGANVHDVVCKH